MKNFLIILFGAGLLVFPCIAQPSGYTQSAVLKIDHTKVANSDQVNFPVLVTAQANALRAVVNGGWMQNSNAYDIVFTSDAAGTALLPYERVRHDLAFGRIVYWVQVPLLSHTTDTPIYVWFGNPTVTTDQSQPGAVWDSNYKGVWHMADSASNTMVVDSTNNQHNGSNAANTNSRMSLGKITNLTALQYSSQAGSGDYTSVPSGSGGDFDFTTGNFTFEFWLNMAPLPPAKEEAFFGNGGTNAGRVGYWLWTLNGMQKLIFVAYQGSTQSGLTTNATLTPGTWVHVALVRSGSNVSFYINGAPDSSISNFVNASSSSGPLVLGGDVGDANRPGCVTANGCFAGSFEEFRVSNTNRSADWITTSYNNQNNPATFFSQMPWDAATNGLAPICNAGAPQSFRAGVPATLDGTGSYSLTGAPLSYVWQQVSSEAIGVPMQRLRWSSHTAAKPTITGLVFGPADFRLTVTQPDGENASCFVNHGAVATDDTGAVLTATGNAKLDSAIYNLLGPMVQLGKNPWPFYDTAAQTDAAIRITSMDTQYQDFWNVSGPGTIAVTANSKTVMGNGTKFLSSFCNSDGTVSSTYPLIGIIAWYPTNDPNYPGQTGRRVVGGAAAPFLVGCQSDTQMTLTQPWLGDVAACPTGQNPPCWLNYAFLYGPNTTPGNAWAYGNAPADYYDEVAAYYALYYRSGQDIYLLNARKLADRFWTSYQMDRGNAFQAAVLGWPTQFRCWALMGMVLRALDTADGHQNMWPGIYKALQKSLGPYWLQYSYPGGIDPRESGYGLAQLSYCALYADDPTWQERCRLAIQSSFTAGSTNTTWSASATYTLGDSVLYNGQRWVSVGLSNTNNVPQAISTAWWVPYTNLWAAAQDAGTGAWLNLSGGASSWSTQTSVSLQNGSTAVTCNGNCNWTASNFGIRTNTTTGLKGGVPIWFTNNPAVMPTTNSDGDPDTYCYQAGSAVAACTFVDANHIVLDRPYSEPGCDSGCTKGYLLEDLVGNPGNVGYDQEPFTEGILAWAFDLAGRAMACTDNNVPIGCDNGVSAQAYQNNTSAVKWMISNGYRAATYGMYYIAGGPLCSAPVSEGNIWCTAGDAIASREYAADGLRGMMVYYQRTGDPNAKGIIDDMYAGLWGKPGTNPIVPSPDGTYDTSFDTCPGCGYWLAVNATAHKLFGQMFGFGRGDNWPVIRSGGPLGSQAMNIYVAARIEDVPNAGTINVTVTEPTGMVRAPVVCTASPCLVAWDPRSGNPIIQVTYLSATGAVLHTGEPFVAVVK